MSKRIFTILIFALALSLFAGAAEITSANDMLTLMNTPSMWADDYILTTDINLADATNGLSQTPIGTAEIPFTGTFDGDYKTITGIDISGATQIGLFGFAADATIENLTIYGTVSGTGNCVGGFVGHVDTASVTIENCVNHCTVTGVDSVGGIIGRVETASSTVYIGRCINEGAINATRYAAGIAGFHSQTGGATTIEKCINNGAVSASSSYAAGISAYWRVYGGAANKCFVQDCINTGNVTVKGSSGYAGGIIAYGSNRNYKYTITRCLNTGSITASKYSRPIAGTVSAATNTAGQFNNCYYTSTDTYTTDSYGVETYVADFGSAANFAGLGENWVLADGYAPELKVFHTHDYKYVSAGENHNYVCYCGDVSLTEAHNFVDGVCDKCGAEDVPCTHENKYEVVETVATCTTAGNKYEFCPDCNIKVSADVEIAIDATNHSDNALTMAYANGAVTYTCECGAVVYTDNALLDTVYVSEEGLELVGNITAIGTESAPFKNFTDAMQYAAYCGKDVTINILDSATTPASYVTPAFDSTVTVTGGKFMPNNRFVMNGEFVFEHIEIAPTATLVMAAKEHKLVMGEGIVMSGSGIYLVGGYENSTCLNSDIPAAGFATDITLRSGTYHAVGGGNRYLSGAYSGTINITIGKTNPNDTLEITSTFATASLSSEGGDGVNATIIIDGTVDNINSFCPVTHASSASGRFDIDIVVKGAATTDAGKLIYRGSDYTVNVYADERVAGAEEFAAVVVGADNVQPYKRYCIKINGAHPDENEDTICDNCGAPTACEHESGEWREVAEANCVRGALYTWYCADCQELIEDKTKVGETVNSDNHASEDFTWQYNEGKYFFVCSACGERMEQTAAPCLYVSQSGNDTLAGTTKDKALATVEEAVSRIANVGGTVVICGEYALSGDLTLPAYSKEITICGSDNAGEYGSFVISKNVVITLGGKTKFDKIGFGGTSVYVFECMWNNTTFGEIQPYNKATAYVVLGDYAITENDDTAASATLTITEGTSQRHTASGVRYVARFYERIYLGDTFATDGIGVSGKTATLNATNADIGILYTMSTSGTYKNNPVTACETTVNLYGSTKVDNGRTGDYNVGYADSTASIAKQTLNFFDNSYIGSNYYIRNANETIINVSTAAQGRNVPIRCPFTFYAYGTFASENTPVKIDFNYGTHSFSSVVEPLAFQNAADALKVVNETMSNECEYSSKVTEAATPDKNGTLLYSCYCGRRYTEKYAYSCEDATHIYTAKANGSFVCDVCGETFEAVLGDSQFALCPAVTSGGTVDVVLSVNASAIAAAQINITAPEGFTFTGAKISEVEGFYVNASESDPCVVTLLSTTGENAEINTNLTLAYSVAETVAFGEYVFELTVPEAYGENSEALVATPVSAIVTVASEEEIVYAAQIGDVKYATIADAFAAANDGDTITALEKITVTGTEVWDLTGKTLELAAVADNYALVVKGNLTIEGGNFVANTLFGIGVTGSLTINGGTFTTDKDYYLIGTWGETVINGGEFTAIYNNVNCFAGALSITGGNFTVTGTDEEYPSSDVFAEDGGVATITGGTFSTDPSDYIADGFKVESFDGKYGIVEDKADAGDIDGDGVVAIKDALDLIRSIVNNNTVENGDVNGDGKVNLADVIRVFKLIVK